MGGHSPAGAVSLQDDVGGAHSEVGDGLQGRGRGDDLTRAGELLRLVGGVPHARAHDEGLEATEVLNATEACRRIVGEEEEGAVADIAGSEARLVVDLGDAVVGREALRTVLHETVSIVDGVPQESEEGVLAIGVDSLVVDQPLLADGVEVGSLEEVGLNADVAKGLLPDTAVWKVGAGHLTS